ncbi:LOW QUALITY PROTEIN: la-related protein 6B-like [Lolium rigidum]|uniref:LOW QUALITY PROTEIN: la-related protein 6B-like n=1 Tax=Lolium rigidum TaxID=89674 RepID=UPI001F5C8B82|nr:LOW QUALITY PROTEIN: la-related protein 6B-like [Lolium rigidum]
MPDPAAGDEPAAPGALSRSSSASRLNAQAPEFVPRPPAPLPAPLPVQPPAVIHVFAGPPPPPPASFFVAGPPPPRPPPPFEYYAAAGGAAAGFGAVLEHEAGLEQPLPLQPPPAQPQQQGRELNPDDLLHKITKQVEYYFSDINLATTEHLMRFITKDPEGYVPMSVVASFKKIKSLLQSNSMLASALRTSSKLVVSEDGNRVKREQPFTESDLEELQARIVVAENLPDDHCYQNLMKIFSSVGSVRTIRTCYPQTPNGTGPVTNRSAKLDMLFANKLHAFVEYDTIEDAEKATLVLNDERNWRSGLRVRLLNSCMAKGGKGRKGGHETDAHGDEDVSTSDQPNDKHLEETSQPSDALGEHVSEESTGDTGRGRGRGRGRGGRGRGRGYNNHNNQYHNNNHPQHHHQNSNNQGNNRGGGHPIGTPPSSHPVKTEQQQTQSLPPAGANKQQPGPRMPDGTRGFSMGRGKPQALTPSLST